MQEGETEDQPIGEAARTPLKLPETVLSSEEEEEDTPEKPAHAESGAQDDELAMLIKQLEARGLCVTAHPKVWLYI
jgi:hypothetical protein